MLGLCSRIMKKTHEAMARHRDEQIRAKLMYLVTKDVFEFHANQQSQKLKVTQAHNMYNQPKEMYSF